jgi:hypothetical protein
MLLLQSQGWRPNGVTDHVSWKVRSTLTAPVRLAELVADDVSPNSRHAVSVKRAVIVVIVATLVSCSTPAASSPAPTARPTDGPASSSASSSTVVATGSQLPPMQVLLRGTLTTVVPGPGQYPMFVQSGTLYAQWIQETPPPYLSKVQRFDDAARVWRDVFTDDAQFSGWSADTGKLALLEYREVVQGGGASESTVLLVDFGTGATTPLDRFALSAATFHGGGGGPRRPRSTLVISGAKVAWSRLNELPGGVVEAELRIADLAEPGRFTTIGRSTLTIEPLWIDARTVGYLLGGPEQDEIRVRDLASGTERTLARVTAPFQDRGIGGIARSGRFIGWIDNLPSGSGARGSTMTSIFHATDIATGATRDLDLRSVTCRGLSGNAIGFAWWPCQPDQTNGTSLAYFDPVTWTNLEIVRSSDRPNDLQAVDGGFMWFDVIGGVRRLNLLLVR